jgi:hypothetical protein
VGRVYWPHFVDHFDDQRRLECPSAEALVAEAALRDKTKDLESDGRLTFPQAHRALAGIVSITDPDLAIKTLVDSGLVLQVSDNTIELADWSEWMKPKAELDEIRQKRAESGRLGGISRARQLASADAGTLLSTSPSVPSGSSTKKVGKRGN